MQHAVIRQARRVYRVGKPRAVIHRVETLAARRREQSYVLLAAAREFRRQLPVFGDPQVLVGLLLRHLDHAVRAARARHGNSTSSSPRSAFSSTGSAAKGRAS
jgi:hypothetical protein